MLFGYYHVNTEHLTEVKEHTNLVMFQTANPSQSLSEMIIIHPKASFIIEFSAYTVHFEKGQKILRTTPERVNAILDALEPMVKRYKQYIYAFSMFDEAETNSETMRTIAFIIAEIMKRPLLADIKRHGNYHNIYSHYTRTPFVIIPEMDIISLTPDYGKYCNLDLCESYRYDFFLNAIAGYNQANPGKPLSLLIIGDGWHKMATNDNHLQKSNLLYSTIKKKAEKKLISVIGQVVFSYSAPGEGVVRNNWMLADQFKEIGTEMISGITPSDDLESQPVKPVEPARLRCYYQ